MRVCVAMSCQLGWVLDCHQDGDEMVVWVKLDSGKVISFRENWEVALHVSSSIRRLQQLSRWLSRREMVHAFGIHSSKFEEHFLELGATNKSTVLTVKVSRPRVLKKLAETIDARGNWHHHELYSVDQKMDQRYLIDRGIHPFGRVKISGDEIESLDDRCDMSLELPPLKIVHLYSECYDEHGHRTASAPLTRIILTPRGDLENEVEGEPIIIDHISRHEMLSLLHQHICDLDPDVIVTDAGDSIDLPAIRNLSESIWQPLKLSRNEVELTPRSSARTAWSYGHLLRKESYHALQGRIHIDMAGSFIVREGGLAGLLELSRMSGLSGQDISRLSPGSAISAMQMRQAMEDGVLVPWKKNRPEDVKDGLELLAADRGGLYLEPSVGVHKQVVELDFASLFPSIIATRNISPETLNCICCDPSEFENRDADDGRLPLLVADARDEVNRRLAADCNEQLTMPVPELSLHTCTRRHGFLGRVVAPIIERRMQLKAMRKHPGDAWDGRQNALKWVLVTCFGYTGYRNARFGRIECHEAICAWAREILLQAIEIASEEGWETLHAIVDSMWLLDLQSRDKDSRKRSIDKILSRLESQIGIPADLEDIYHWICFIPNRTTGVGALTKYFGHGDEGWKVRGIELRQHSTCAWIEQLQNSALAILKNDISNSAQNKVTKHLHAEIARLKRRGIPLVDLVVARRIRRELGDQRVETVASAAVHRAAWLGRRIPPGNKVRFAVTSWRNNDINQRVRLSSEIESNTSAVNGQHGDIEFYEPLALRAIWAILSPFGWDESAISRSCLLPLTLDSFCLKSESDA